MNLFGGRLTLQQAQPLITSDCIGVNRAFLAPFESDSIPLVLSDGSVVVRPFTSGPTDQVGMVYDLDPAFHTPNLGYDFFAYDDSGVTKLGTTAGWTNLGAPPPPPPSGNFLELTGGQAIGGMTANGGVAAANTGDNAKTSSASSFSPSPASSGYAAQNSCGVMFDTPQTVTKLELWSPTDDGFIGNWTAIGFKLMASNTNDISTAVQIASGTLPSGSAAYYEQHTGIDTSAAYTCFWTVFQGNGTNAVRCARRRLYITSSGTTTAPSGPTSRAATQLYKGVPVNSADVPLKTAAGVVTIPAGQAIHVGAVRVGDVAGQVTAHRTYGPSRLYDVWNRHNQRRVIIEAGAEDPRGGGTASWAILRGNAGNSLKVFCGDQQDVRLSYYQSVNCYVPAGGSAWASNAFGINSGTVPSGTWGQWGRDNGASVSNPANPGACILATHRIASADSVGETKVNALVSVVEANGGSVTFFTANGIQEKKLVAEWMA